MFYPIHILYKVCVSTVLFLCAMSSAMSAETILVSVNTSGVQGGAASYNGFNQGISANARYVVFQSDSNNLVSGDTNNRSDIFVYDRRTKQTSRVSVSSAGVQGNAHSHNPLISADGRMIAFSSNSNNLVAGDTNNSSDVFVHDRETKQTTRISVSSNGTQANTMGSSVFDGSFPTSMSTDGRFVAFTSNSTNLVMEDGNKSSDCFVHDRVTATTTRISVNSDGTQGNGHSNSGILSADGRFVAFNSSSDNLVNADTNDMFDAFVHDRKTGQTQRVSISSNGQQGNNGGLVSGLNADGRFVAFSSYSNNLVAGDTNEATDAFVHDRVTGTTTRVSVRSDGGQANRSDVSYDGSYGASLSADGRFVAFVSDSPNLVPADTNFTHDAFIHDRITGRTKRVSVSSAEGQGDKYVYGLSMSADGRYLAMTSDSTNLVAEDANLDSDVFVHDRLLDSTHFADLKVVATQQPSSLAANNAGTYQFTVTNQGPNTATDARITYTVSNGMQLIGLVPSQGYCNSYATISICRFGALPSGKSLTLSAVAKASINPLVQRVTVSGESTDNVLSNNYINISTAVKP